MEGFRRTWRAVALAVVFALVGASFALAMPAAINFVTRTATSESTLQPLPPGSNPSPLYTPAAPVHVDPDADDEAAGSAKTEKAREKAASDTVGEDSSEAGRARRPDRSRKGKKVKEPKRDRPERPEKPVKPEKPAKPEKPDRPEKPESQEPAGSTDPAGETPQPSGKPEEKPKEEPPAPEAEDTSDEESSGKGKGKGGAARPTKDAGGTHPGSSERANEKSPGRPSSDPPSAKDKH